MRMHKAPHSLTRVWGLHTTIHTTRHQVMMAIGPEHRHLRNRCMPMRAMRAGSLAKE